MKEKRTGLVCTVEAVPEGHQVGIVWTNNGQGRQIGFAYDEDETKRDEIASKIEGFCSENNFTVGEYLASVSWIEQARIEEISQDLFINWFGGKPRAAALFYDGWGRVDDFKKAYGIPEEYTSPAMAESRTRTRYAGMKAGGVTAGILAIGLAVFIVVSYAIAGDAPVSVSAYMLAGTILTVLGGVLLIAETQRIARYFYRKFL